MARGRASLRPGWGCPSATERGDPEGLGSPWLGPFTAPQLWEPCRAPRKGPTGSLLLSPERPLASALLSLERGFFGGVPFTFLGDHQGLLPSTLLSLPPSGSQGDFFLSHTLVKSHLASHHTYNKSQIPNHHLQGPMRSDLCRSFQPHLPLLLTPHSLCPDSS